MMTGKFSSQPDFDAFSVNAAWEPSGDKMRCRWFVAWQPIGKNQIAGAIAGYSGGGAFEAERFWGEFEDGTFNHCWIDCTDRVTEEEVDYSSLSADIKAVCESAYALLFKWNDADEWGDSENVHLRSEHKGKLVAKRGVWRLEAPHFVGLSALCSYAGLETGPGE